MESCLPAVPAIFCFLPAGLPHAYIVGAEKPLRQLALAGAGAPSSFGMFVQQASEPARERRLPQPAQLDPEALREATAQHGIEILGPPPQAGSLEVSVIAEATDL